MALLPHQCPLCGLHHKDPDAVDKPTTGSIEKRFLALLPQPWPAGGTRAEQAYLKGAIDLLFRGAKAPPQKPYSAGGSVNHKIAAATVYGLRYGDWKPLLDILAAFKIHGLFCLGPNADETLTGYVPFYVSHLMMALMRVAGFNDLMTLEILKCLDGILWWLEECTWEQGDGRFRSPGLRVYRGDIPSWWADKLRDALQGKPVPLDHEKMDNEGGRRTEAGYPVSHAIWLTLIARERGLLRDLRPVEPKLRWPLIVVKSNSHFTAWLSGPITQPESDVLLAVGVRAGQEWWAQHSTPASFNPVTMEVEPI